MAQPRPRARASDTRRETRSAGNNGAEHRDGWRPNSLVAEQVQVIRSWHLYVKAHPHNGSVRVTATWRWSYVADHPVHADKNIPTTSEVRVPESLVVALSDMHEEKNIDTVIQSIYRLRGTGQVELFRVVVQFTSAVFRMHWFWC